MAAARSATASARRPDVRSSVESACVVVWIAERVEVDGVAVHQPVGALAGDAQDRRGPRDVAVGGAQRGHQRRDVRKLRPVGAAVRRGDRREDADAELTNRRPPPACSPIRVGQVLRRARLSRPPRSTSRRRTSCTSSRTLPGHGGRAARRAIGLGPARAPRPSRASSARRAAGCRRGARAAAAPHGQPSSRASRVGAEAAVLDAAVERLLTGDDDADVDRHRRVRPAAAPRAARARAAAWPAAPAADPTPRRGTTCPPCAPRKTPGLARSAPVNAPARYPNSSPSAQRLGNGGAVDRDERARRPLQRGSRAPRPPCRCRSRPRARSAGRSAPPAAGARAPLRSAAPP